MTQLSSNTVAYDQVFLKVRDFIISETEQKFQSLEERTTAYNKLLQDIYENVAQPLTNFEPFIKGEPPQSAKMNKYASDLAYDLNIIGKQIDFLNAKTVNIYNMFFNEIENEKKYAERIGSKAKILQMYSKSPSNDLVYYGDNFDSMDQIDVSKIRSRHMPLVMNGECCLPIASSRALRPKRIYVNKERGFLGNNHQIIKAQNSGDITNSRYIFEDTPGIASLSSIGDSNPLTFFEVEVLNVAKTRAAISAGPSEKEFCYVSVNTENTSQLRNQLINWSDADMSVPLEASFVMEFQSGKANCIEIIPYFGSSKLAKITQVTITRKDGTKFNLLDEPLFIGSSFTPLNVRVANAYFYNKATLRFAETEMSQAEVFFQQEEYEEIDIGHVYWKPNYPQNADSGNPFVGMARFNPDDLNREIYDEVEYDPLALLPKTTKPNEFKKNNIVKNIKVRLKTKPQTFNFWVIKFARNRRNDTPDVGDITAYFSSWIDPEDTSKGFNLTDRVNFRNNTLNVKNFSSEEEAESDLSKLIAFINAQPNQEIEINNAFYKISNIVTDLLTYSDNGYVINYDVPVINVKELYRARRMSIGIRDLSLRYETYASQAEVVSTPYIFDKNVEALMLSVNSSVDNTFANDISMEYYISVNDSSWISISPIQLDNKGIAEVLVFNKNLTDSAKLPGVAYLNYPDVPKDIRKVLVKIVFSKLRSANVTPSIYSYELIARVEN